MQLTDVTVESILDGTSALLSSQCGVIRRFYEIDVVVTSTSTSSAAPPPPFAMGNGNSGSSMGTHTPSAHFAPVKLNNNSGKVATFCSGQLPRFS